MLSLLLMIFLLTISFADSKNQASWSGGSGVQGPVTEWDDTFWNSTVTLNVTGGNVELLSYPPVGYLIDEYFGYPHAISAIDIDGDEDFDVVGVDLSDLTWWENADGYGTDWIEHEICGDISGNSIHTTDIDGDGDNDIVSAEREEDRISLWENVDSAGGVWQPHIIDEDFGGAHSVNSADVDCDGDADILGAAYYMDHITWWENNGNTGDNWIEHTIDDDFDGAISVFSNDIDGDNYPDVLGAAWYSDEIAWWENSDTAPGIIWTRHAIDTDFHLACTIVSEDIDGDGDADVVAGSYGEDGISWWENADGIGEQWIEHMIDWEFTSVAEVHSADIDGDGDMDVAGTGFYIDQVSWWENNNGLGTGWTEHVVVQSYSRPISICSADMNCDGDTDLLGCAMSGRSIDWWDVDLLYHQYGSLVSSILDAGYVAEWDDFVSSSQEPAGTSLFFLLRSSNDYNDMGAWSDTIFSSDTTLAGFTSDSSRFLQYKVVLVTSDESISPELTDVEFSYTPQVGVSDGTSAHIDLWSVKAFSNPSHNLFSAIISVPEEARVELEIFDVTGRLVSGEARDFSSGTHTLTFPGLDNGVYFCVMSAGEFTTSCRFVVID